MIITLSRIKKDKFDDLVRLVLGEFETTGELAFDEKVIEEYSEPIVIDGQAVELVIDLDKYQAIIDEDSFGYTKNTKVGMLLHKDLKSDTVEIPRNIFYDYEVWAYLSLTCFKDIVKHLREKGLKKITEKTLKQFYFNVGPIDRIGLMFLWCMVDRLDSENDYEITHTAFEFVDPVKNMLATTSLSKGTNVLRAFVQGIINNNKDARFKSDKFRSKVTSNVSCYASVNMLDMLEYNELVDVITEQQKAIISEK